MMKTKPLSVFRKYSAERKSANVDTGIGRTRKILRKKAVISWNMYALGLPLFVLTHLYTGRK